MKGYHNGKMIEQGHEPRLLYSVYEVIRVANGKIHFLAEHLRRLERSWNLSDRLRRKEYIGFEKLVDICNQVVETNQLRNQNFRVDLDANNTYVRPVESFYPDAKDYEVGVNTMSISYTRQNPNAKVQNIMLTDKVRQLRSIENVFEVLLVNGDGKVLEGSRSNLFFIKGESVYTAPIDDVLGGVRREVLLKIIENHPELRLYNKAVSIDEVFMYDCCFITGTSIDLLPVRRIDSQIFRSASNPVYQMLLREFRSTAKII